MLIIMLHHLYILNIYLQLTQNYLKQYYIISAFYSQSLPLSSLSNISDLFITTINGIPKLILITLSCPSIYYKYYVTKIFYIKIPLFFMSSNSYSVNFNSESND